MVKQKLKSKLIHKIDDEIYTRFAGYCKAERKIIGQALSELMLGALENKTIKRGK